MQIILFIYLGVSIVNFLLAYLIGYCAAKKYIQKYPDFKAPKKDFIEKIATHIRTFLLCFIPIVNIIMILVFIFKWDELTNNVMKNLEKEKP